MTGISDEVIKELIRRVEGESDAAYSAFCRFALLDEKDRPFEKSIPLLAQTTNLSESSLKQYSNLYKWNERVGSILSYLLMLNIKEQHEQNKELNLTFIETNRKLREDMMENNRKAMKVLSNVLNWAMVANEEKILRYVEDKDGNQVPVTTEFKMPFKIADIPSMISALKKGVELVNEIPTEIINAKPISNKNINEIEDLAELEKLEKELESEIMNEESGTIQ